MAELFNSCDLHDQGSCQGLHTCTALSLIFVSFKIMYIKNIMSLYISQVQVWQSGCNTCIHMEYRNVNMSILVQWH